MLSAVTLIACGRFAFTPAGRDGDGGVTGDSDVGDAGDASDIAPPCGPWGSITHVASVSTVGDDWEPAVTGDGLTMVFSRRTAGVHQLWMSTRTSTGAAFRDPRELNELDEAVIAGSTSYSPMWSMDYTKLYYIALDNLDQPTFFVVSFDASTQTFGTPATTNLPADESWELASEGLEIFITDSNGGDFALGHATRTSMTSPWQPQPTFDTANALPGAIGWPSFDDARQELYVETYFPSLDAMRLAVAQRSAPGQPFSAFAAIPELDFEGGDPDISPDGTRLVFASDGRGDGTENEIYIATRSCPP